MALLIILGIRTIMGEAAFADWGWRIPFLLSIVLLGISVWIRLQALNESPMFQKMKDEGKASKAPLTEAFGNWPNAKVAILALLAARPPAKPSCGTAGEFYALFFLTQTLKVPSVTAWLMIVIALAIATPGFILFGWLSDKIGRKPIMLAGFALAVLTYFPLFHGHYAPTPIPKLEKALETASPVVVTADPAECSFQFNPTGTRKIHHGLRQHQGHAGEPVGQLRQRQSGCRHQGQREDRRSGDRLGHAEPAGCRPGRRLSEGWRYGYREDGASVRHLPNDINRPMTVLLLFILVMFVTMVYGPIAAMLVELFPTRIRYTSMSLPYHIGNGWFGGLLPATAFAIVASTGDIYAGLWYPIIFASATVVIGFFFLPETKDVDITK